MIILKGPELASRYPEGFRRDGRRASTCWWTTPTRHMRRSALAGFVPTGDPRLSVDIHHLQPLVWPGLPVRIEVHHSVKWIEGLEPPSQAELFALAAPSRVDVDGFQDPRAGGACGRRRHPRLVARPTPQSSGV